MLRYLAALGALSLPVMALAQSPSGPPQAPAPAPVALPDTPAGRFVTVFLKAYNSADPAELEKYNALYARKTPPEQWIEMHDMTGDLTPVRVTSTDPNAIEVLLYPGKGDQFWREQISMDPTDPMKFAGGGLSPAPRPPEYAIPAMPLARLNAAADARIATDVAADRFSGVLVVERHGKVIYAGAGGMADRAGKVPITLETKFRIGSANKMFTSVSVLQLVEKGLVDLDASVGTYLPDYPNRQFADTVTVRQLLSHTGGAGDIFTPEYEAKRLETRTLADYVTLFGDRAPDTSEEGRNAYANYGFVVLGRIVEAVSGETYYDYVRAHVYAPAGMTHSGSLPEEVAVPGRSKGYMKGPGGTLIDNAGTLPWRASAAGGGYTTAGDMIRFANALRSGKLISPASLKQATSPQRPDGWYGLGFVLDGEGKARRWGHGGGAPGMNAAFRVMPEYDAVIVALANMDPMAADLEADFYANRMDPGE